MKAIFTFQKKQEGKMSAVNNSNNSSAAERRKSLKNVIRTAISKAEDAGIISPKHDHKHHKITLPRHTQELLMSLYLRLDGVTLEKIPNLVAELNLSVPVDFSVEKYFRSQNGTRQLILQPDDLCRFVQDLQNAVDHPNNGINDTCQVLTSGDLIQSPSTHGDFYGTDDPNGRSSTFEGSHQDRKDSIKYIERVVVEAALERFLPESHVSESASKTVFASANVKAAGDDVKKTTKPITGVNRAVLQRQRQTIEEFRHFLESDVTTVQLSEAFKKLGATDDGIGLVLTASTLTAVCRQHHIPQFVAVAAVDILDEEELGEIDVTLFITIAAEQLHESQRIAKVDGPLQARLPFPGSGLLGVEQQPTAHAPPVALILAAVAPGVVVSLTDKITLQWLLDQKKISANRSASFLGKGNAKDKQSNGSNQNLNGAPTNGAQSQPSNTNLNSTKTSRDVQDITLSKRRQSEDLEELLSAALGTTANNGMAASSRNGNHGGAPSSSRLQRLEALPKYMEGKLDDEITASIKHRVQQRKSLDRARAQSARTNIRSVGLRLAFVSKSRSPREKEVQSARSKLRGEEYDEDQLDIDAVLNSQPQPNRSNAQSQRAHLPKPPPPSAKAQPSSLSKLCDPKCFALLRVPKSGPGALSEGNTVADRFFINDGEEHVPPSDGSRENSATRVPRKLVSLLTDPYAVPPFRHHSSKDVHYVYRNLVDSWRVSPRRHHEEAE